MSAIASSVPKLLLELGGQPIESLFPLIETPLHSKRCFVNLRFIEQARLNKSLSICTSVFFETGIREHLCQRAFVVAELEASSILIRELDAVATHRRQRIGPIQVSRQC
jgi:hypothetical protein